MPHTCPHNELTLQASYLLRDVLRALFGQSRQGNMLTQLGRTDDGGVLHLRGGGQGDMLTQLSRRWRRTSLNHGFGRRGLWDYGDC